MEPAELSIRPLAESEYPAASAIVVRSILSSFGGHYPPDVMQVLIEQNGPEWIRQRSAKQEDYLARRGPAPTGYVGVKRNEIGHLFIDPEAMGQGIGTALVAFSERLFRDRGHRTALVYASLNAVGFYQKLGYRETGRGAFEIKPAVLLAYVRMEKDL